jgi:L-rhamnonate dehydratase
VKITVVEAFCLRRPETDPPGNSATDASIVHVGTDAGIDGYAEVDGNPWAVKAIVEAPTTTGLRQGLRPLLLGQSPLEPELLWARMHAETLNYGRSGAVIHALAGIDQALWDIKGKALGKPVHVLLGGARRERLRCYATRGFGPTPADTADRARAAMAAGFDAVKLGWGPFGRDPDFDERLVTAARGAIGDSNDLMIDCGLAFDARAAIESCRRLAPYRPVFIEEPLQPDDLDGYAALSAATDLTIAAGEQETTFAGFRRLLDAGLGLAQIDVTRVGVTESVRIAAMAAARGVPCANHSFGTDLNIAASLHVMAAVEKPLIFEYPVEPSLFREVLTRNRLRPVDGRIAVPEEPGIGVEIDLEAVKRFRVA